MLPFFIAKIGGKRMKFLNTINTTINTLNNVAMLTSTSDLLAPLRKLIDLFMAAIALYGVFQIARNAMELNTAYKSSDDSGVSAALKGLIGGFLLAAIGTLLTYLGIKY